MTGNSLEAIYAFRMTEADVTLTDYAIAAECLAFAAILAKDARGSCSIRALILRFFCSLALSALAGGTVHGFFSDKTSAGHKALWRLTLCMLGVTAFCGLQITAVLAVSGQVASTSRGAGLLLLTFYLIVVLFFRQDYFIAILAYLPPLLLLGGIFLVLYRGERKPAFLEGFVGVCTMLLASAGQQLRIGVSRKYFDHNALYHLLQAIALWLLFVALHASCEVRSVPFGTGI